MPEEDDDCPPPLVVGGDDIQTLFPKVKISDAEAAKMPHLYGDAPVKVMDIIKKGNYELETTEFFSESPLVVDEKLSSRLTLKVPETCGVDLGSMGLSKAVFSPPPLRGYAMGNPNRGGDSFSAEALAEMSSSSKAFFDHSVSASGWGSHPAHAQVVEGLSKAMSSHLESWIDRVDDDPASKTPLKRGHFGEKLLAEPFAHSDYLSDISHNVEGTLFGVVAARLGYTKAMMSRNVEARSFVNGIVSDVVNTVGGGVDGHRVPTAKKIEDAFENALRYQMALSADHRNALAKRWATSSHVVFAVRHLGGYVVGDTREKPKAVDPPQCREPFVVSVSVPLTVLDEALAALAGARAVCGSIGNLQHAMDRLEGVRERAVGKRMYPQSFQAEMQGMTSRLTERERRHLYESEWLDESRKPVKLEAFPNFTPFFDYSALEKTMLEHVNVPKEIYAGESVRYSVEKTPVSCLPKARKVPAWDAIVLAHRTYIEATGSVPDTIAMTRELEDALAKEGPIALYGTEGIKSLCGMKVIPGAVQSRMFCDAVEGATPILFPK